jgi:membrane fusion protein (multidrug efflux system)
LSRSRRLGHLIAGAALLALVGTGGAYLYADIVHGEASTPSANDPHSAGEPRVAVEVSPVIVDTIVDEIRVVGTLQANESLVLQPEISGRVAQFRFREGEKVKAGDVLVELDPAILDAELAKARSDLTLAQSNYERASTLARQGTGTLKARDETLAALQSAQAGYALADARLKKATIRAPFSGILGFRLVSVGEYVNPGDGLVDLADVDPIKVDFRVAEVFLPSIKVGQTIAVTADALPGQTFDGEIYAIHPMVDVNGRAVRLRARIANPNGALYPGLFARVSIIVEKRSNALLVPESAIYSLKNRKLVYRVADGRAILTEVTVGRRRPGQVEIVSGLDRDSVIVTAGQQQLRDGTRVEAVRTAPGT